MQRGGNTLIGYPALVDAGDAVTLQVFDSPEKAREEHRGGVRRLLAIAFRDRVRDLERTLAKDVALGPLKVDVVTAALERTFLAASLPMTQADFARRLDEGRSRFSLIAQEIARTAAGILAEKAALERFTQGLASEVYQYGVSVTSVAPSQVVPTPGTVYHRLVSGLDDPRGEPPLLMAQAALLLATEPLDRVTGRVTYSQQILREFGWIEHGRGRGVDSRGSGYSEI